MQTFLPNWLVASCQATQVAGSLFLGPSGYFLVEDRMVPCTNAIANMLYHSYCSKGLQFNGKQLSAEDIRYIINIFSAFDCSFIDGYWMEMKQAGLHVQK